ncbi:MAG TPA: PspC domain-containing protein [Thermoanaerobaculaceae bacterium]|nr:PspC domain-containing protein [Thermoanaerobaculaceae bacterium]
MAAVAQKCQRCLRDVSAGASFCPGCGARVAGEPRPLRRRRDNEKLAGVCAGLAEYFDLDVTLVRVVFAVAAFVTGIIPGVILYVVLALLIPAS